jgi:Asp/Glu/hydantoin racemase
VNKLAIIHTTAVTIPLLKELASEILPGCTLLHWLDDSILPQLRDGDEAVVQTVANKWTTYARYAEEAGAECILSACSSVGDIAERAAGAVTVPVIRIDDAMADLAVSRGRRIGVAATLETTMRPTLNLLQRKAANLQDSIQLIPLVVSEAYAKLMDGDQKGHDELLAEQLQQLSQRCDVVVLAQASMSRVIPALPEEIGSRMLTSPRLGMERLKQLYFT